MRASYDEVQDALPEEPGDGQSATLRFEGERWEDDQAVETGDRCTFTIPLEHLHTGEDWAIHSTVTAHHVADGLRQHENAPEWASRWSGPFEVRLETVTV